MIHHVSRTPGRGGGGKSVELILIPGTIKHSSRDIQQSYGSATVSRKC
jgi:hypothetical protein